MMDEDEDADENDGGDDGKKVIWSSLSALSFPPTPQSAAILGLVWRRKHNAVRGFVLYSLYVMISTTAEATQVSPFIP